MRDTIRASSSFIAPCEAAQSRPHSSLRVSSAIVAEMELVDFICELLLGWKAGWCSEHSSTEVRTLTKSSVNVVSEGFSSGTMLSSSVARRSGDRLVKVPRWGLLLLSRQFSAPYQYWYAKPLQRIRCQDTPHLLVRAECFWLLRC